MFCLATTLCENGGMLEMMVRSEDIFVPHVVPHPIFEPNCMKVSKVPYKSWHVVMAKLHDVAHGFDFNLHCPLSSSLVIGFLRT